MRKYKQLLLLILTTVSLVLLLVYRHEYNRLHYVLEVFNFFGQPCNLSELIETNNIVNHHDWGPTPLFSDDGELYVYSSFWMPTKEAKSIVLHSDKTNHAKNCYLWYEEREDPIIGKFKYAKIERDNYNNLEMFHYFCAGANLNTPYAVSYNKNKRIKHPLNIERKKIMFNMTICIAPSSEIKKETLSEFLSFHTLIGIDSYVIYSDNLPYRLIKIILNLSSKLGIKITFYPWNFPKPDTTLSKVIVEHDCLLRTINQSKYVATLNINELIVPSTHYALKDILHVNDKSDRFNLPVQKFCIEYDDPKKPIALQNVQTIHDEDNAIQVIYKNNHDSGVISAQGIDKGMMSLHKYIYCTDKGYKTYVDNSILKYSTDFIRSTLVQLVIHKQL